MKYISIPGLLKTEHPYNNISVTRLTGCSSSLHLLNFCFISYTFPLLPISTISLLHIPLPLLFLASLFLYFTSAFPHTSLVYTHICFLFNDLTHEVFCSHVHRLVTSMPCNGRLVDWSLRQHFRKIIANFTAAITRGNYFLAYN